MSGQPEPDRKAGGFDAGAIRRQFAILNREIAWLDNAATTQRPEAVLKAMDETNGRRALAAAEAWRPFRAYAVLHLWKSLEKTRNKP